MLKLFYSYSILVLFPLLSLIMNCFYSEQVIVKKALKYESRDDEDYNPVAPVIPRAHGSFWNKVNKSYKILN